MHQRSLRCAANDRHIRMKRLICCSRATYDMIGGQPCLRTTSRGAAPRHSFAFTPSRSVVCRWHELGRKKLMDASTTRSKNSHQDLPLLQPMIPLLPLLLLRAFTRSWAFISRPGTPVHDSTFNASSRERISEREQRGYGE
jgi:hypothetical protein